MKRVKKCARKTGSLLCFPYQTMSFCSREQLLFNIIKILLRTQCDLKWVKQNLQAEKVYWACLRLRVACHNLFTLFGSSLLFVNPCLVMIFRKLTTLSCSLWRVKALMWMSSKAYRRYTRWNFKSLIYANRSKSGIHYAKCKSEVV